MSVPQLPGFRYVKPLGRGGYGEVFSAYQDQFDRWVAVKVLGFTLTDQRLQRQFVRECRLAGRLSAHPNIVTVYDSGIVAGGHPYITMELFPDGSISDALRQQGPFAVPDAVRIGIALAGALETAHGAGVVHRDVKPANVLLATYGQPALTDFGLSIVAEQHEVSMAIDALTPYHAAPEVLERTAATPVSDVYSLASTVYAMLAGRAPHQASGDSPDSIAALLLRVLQRDVPPLDRPDAPPSLRAALERALSRDAATRTPTARAFAAELQAVQRELGLEVTEPVVMDVPGKVDPAAPEPDRTGLVIPPPPPAPPAPGAPPAPPAPGAPPAPPAPGAPLAPPAPPAPPAGGVERPPLPSRTPGQAGTRGNGAGTEAAEPSLDQLAALERALLGQPPPPGPVDPPDRARRPPPAPLRRRPDTPAPPRPPVDAPAAAHDPPPPAVPAARSSPPAAPPAPSTPGTPPVVPDPVPPIAPPAPPAVAPAAHGSAPDTPPLAPTPPPAAPAHPTPAPPPAPDEPWAPPVTGGAAAPLAPPRAPAGPPLTPPPGPGSPATAQASAANAPPAPDETAEPLAPPRAPAGAPVTPPPGPGWPATAAAGVADTPPAPDETGAPLAPPRVPGGGAEQASGPGWGAVVRGSVAPPGWPSDSELPQTRAGWPSESESPQVGAGDEGLPAWVTEAMGGGGSEGGPPADAPAAAASAPVGFAEVPEGDMTIERSVVRGYLPPAAPAPAPVHDERPRRGGRVLAAVVGVLVVVAAAMGAYVLLAQDDSEGGRPEDETAEPDTPATTVEVPSGLTAAESPAGVQLDWDGDDAETYAVLMMSEIAAPQVLPAEEGSSMLVPATRLSPDDAYCFAVAYLSALSADPTRTEDAFGPPVCIRGASEDTVRPG